MIHPRNLYRAAVFAVTYAGGHSGHESGDYLVQRDCDAVRKQKPTPEGRKSLAIHGASYGATQFVTKWAAYQLTGLRVPLRAQLAGTLTEAALHVVIDDGRLLRWFAEATGKDRFHELGAPRRVAAITSEGKRVHLVATDDDGKLVVTPDEHGQIPDAGPHDNPSPATGRALMDQAVHKGLQLVIGAGVTTALAAWLTRK